MLPLVTVVALCHNHAPFLRQALNSVRAQDYPHLEVWLVDDGSRDGSPEVLREYAAANPAWHLLLLPESVGNCRAFNQALRRSRGEFVLDFATDDVLLPRRLSQQVAFFQSLPPDCGMVYSNCELIDEQNCPLGLHHRPDGTGGLVPRPASGWVFAEVLQRYFVSTPTMLFRRACLLDDLGGYDEALSYEDFDFWVRASRNWQFFYLDAVTTQKRKHPQSMSAQSTARHNPYLDSTAAVLAKALELCRAPAEYAALSTRLRYELRHALRRRQFGPARAFYALLTQIGPVSWADRALGWWAHRRL